MDAPFSLKIPYIDGAISFANWQGSAWQHRAVHIPGAVGIRRPC